MFRDDKCITSPVKEMRNYFKWQYKQLYNKWQIKRKVKSKKIRKKIADNNKN